MFQGFVPGRHQVDSFGNGGFRFADMSHRGSILALPSGIHAWRVADIADAGPEDLAPILAERESIDFLLVGTGADLRFLPKNLRAMLKEAGLGVEVMATGAAARTFNVVIAEGRRVAGAFVAVP
jgi:uncharacterized protein